MPSHLSPQFTVDDMARNIPGLGGPATWLGAWRSGSAGCGAGRPITGGCPSQAERRAARVLPLSRVIVLETSGPAPSDTSVTFTHRHPRTPLCCATGRRKTSSLPAHIFAARVRRQWADRHGGGAPPPRGLRPRCQHQPAPPRRRGDAGVRLCPILLRPGPGPPDLSERRRIRAGTGRGRLLPETRSNSCPPLAPSR